jgi:hypothetical protein
VRHALISAGEAALTLRGRAATESRFDGARRREPRRADDRDRCAARQVYFTPRWTRAAAAGNDVSPREGRWRHPHRPDLLRNDHQLEFDFVVAPLADAREIHLLSLALTR